MPSQPPPTYLHNITVSPEFTYATRHAVNTSLRQIFSSDVNSPLKQPQSKEAAPAGGAVNGRKASMSHGSNYGLSSPSTASRPGTRRRETGESSAFPSAGLASPTGAGRLRDDWFPRKSLEARDAPFEDDGDDLPAQARPGAFGTLGRSNTAGGGGLGGASPWGPTGAAGVQGPGSALGSFGSFAMPPTIGDKRFASGRGESRLAHLIPKDSSESISKLSEPSGGDRASWRARNRADVNPYAAEDGLSGSAALLDGRDTSPPPPSRPPQHGHPYDTPLKGPAGDLGLAGLTLGTGDMSDSPETNPYRSPAGDRGDEEPPHMAQDKGYLSGTGPEHAMNYSSLPRGFAPSSAFDASDRSQTSSGGAKGFPTVNALGGWPTGLNTSAPEQSGFGGAFGSSIFSPVGDLQSPGFGGVPGMFAHGAVPTAGQSGSLRGTSKMGSLFPAAMQAQMQHSQEQEAMSDSVPDLRHANPLGAIGGGTIRGQDTDATRQRGLFEELMESQVRAAGPFTSADFASLPATAGALTQGYESNRNETPPNQPRIMVMPDRMRWVYLDPQGTVQGPFTGLEMNDWYKANFFTPDLRVKKTEDTEFEPLGQLIRRIGNSREPFLVPQMGIPHGPPSLAGPLTHGDRGAVIPPLVGAFPAFGRTLTAEEQNNLERRKQEEQYMMARQRELLAHQHHAFGKIQMTPGAPGALHHHSSAHSLQSQPSFGSMTSPLAPQPPPGALGSTQGFFDQSSSIPSQAMQVGMMSSQEFLRDEYNMDERRVLAALHPSGTAAGFMPPQVAGAIASAEPSLRAGLPSVDQLQQDAQGFNERLKEFKELRAQRDAEDAARATMASVAEEEDVAAPQAAAAQIMDEIAESLQEEKKSLSISQTLSLTQQVQKTQAAKHRAHGPVDDSYSWPKPAADLPLPFPPPLLQSATPLPAPTAQRHRSTLPDQYATRSESETPESGTASATAVAPPLAPWAKDPGDGRRGPSLKEIQEAEAKKTAKAEEAAAAARRAAAEQEAVVLRERERAGLAAPPGLPMSSTWGNSSPVTATAGSVWTKPGPVAGAPGLAAAAVTQANARKTLADIQREEEARKRKAKDLATQTGAATGSAMGKRYADLASKTQASSIPAQGAGPSAPPPPGSGWATVGAGGKVKIPTGPSAARPVNTGNAKPAAPATAARPVVKQSISAVAKGETGGAAMEEFTKWLHRELGRGITAGIDSKSRSPLGELSLPILIRP